MVRTRDERDADHAVVGRLIDAAFADGGRVSAVWADVRDRGLVRASVVAVADGEVCGHVGLSHAWLDARARLVDVLVLSPLSVRPDRQRRGIGTVLVEAALEAAASLRAPALFLEGDPAFYGRRGFAPAADEGCAAPSRRTPAPAFQVALLPGHEPWMSGRVVYRDVWWEHDAAGLRDPELAEVERTLGG